MTAAELSAALDALGWSQRRAARVLRVANYQRVGQWCRGERPVPPYIAGAIETHLDLARCRAAGESAGGESAAPQTSGESA